MGRNPRLGVSVKVHQKDSSALFDSNSQGWWYLSLRYRAICHMFQRQVQDQNFSFPIFRVKDVFHPSSAAALWSRESTQGPSWGYLKVNSSETLSISGDKCPQNGSKKDRMAPRTTLECPHEGPSVEQGMPTCERGTPVLLD